MVRFRNRNTGVAVSTNLDLDSEWVRVEDTAEAPRRPAKKAASRSTKS